MPGKKPTRNVPEPGRVWNLNAIQGLLDLLAEKEITEFEMEQQGVKIRVRRGDANAVNAANTNGYSVACASSPAFLAAPPAPAIAVATSPPAPSPAPAVPEPATDSTEGLFIMKSPIVGTFYSSPAPNAPPFVKVGDSVQVGHVICIIEAMKLMNELEAEVAGRIVRAYVENGQPVEYGQSLFAIEPARKK
ncbi:MAG: acetyl-CoA carboxylase biotin carboxyl carrier protein [Terriglobia bacterium]